MQESPRKNDRSIFFVLDCFPGRALSTANGCNMNKSMANLSQLESTSTKRKAEDFPLGKKPRKNSPPPKKVIKSKEFVKDSDEISLDWGSDLDEEIGVVAGLPSKSRKSLRLSYSQRSKAGMAM